MLLRSLQASRGSTLLLRRSLPTTSLSSFPFNFQVSQTDTKSLHPLNQTSAIKSMQSLTKNIAPMATPEGLLGRSRVTVGVFSRLLRNLYSQNSYHQRDEWMGKNINTYSSGRLFGGDPSYSKYRKSYMSYKSSRQSFGSSNKPDGQGIFARIRKVFRFTKNVIIISLLSLVAYQAYLFYKQGLAAFQTMKDKANDMRENISTKVKEKSQKMRESVRRGQETVQERTQQLREKSENGKKRVQDYIQNAREGTEKIKQDVKQAASTLQDGQQVDPEYSKNSTVGRNDSNLIGKIDDPSSQNSQTGEVSTDKNEKKRLLSRMGSMLKKKAESPDRQDQRIQQSVSETSDQNNQ